MCVDAAAVRKKNAHRHFGALGLVLENKKENNVRKIRKGKKAVKNRETM